MFKGHFSKIKSGIEIEPGLIVQCLTVSNIFKLNCSYQETRFYSFKNHNDDSINQKHMFSIPVNSKKKISSKFGKHHFEVHCNDYQCCYTVIFCCATRNEKSGCVS